METRQNERRAAPGNGTTHHRSPLGRALAGAAYLVGLWWVLWSRPEAVCAQGSCPPGQTWRCVYAAGRQFCACRDAGTTPTPQPTAENPPTADPIGTRSAVETAIALATRYADPTNVVLATQAASTRMAQATRIEATRLAGITPTPTPIWQSQRTFECLWAGECLGTTGFCCSSGYYHGVTFVDHAGNSWILTADCMDAAACAPPTPAPPGEVRDPPCPASPIGTGIGVWCGAYDIEVQAQVPPHLVVRRPWPRGLVTVDNGLTLLPDPRFSLPNGADGEWSERGLPRDLSRDGTHAGQIANYQMGLRWRRLTPPEAPAPHWTFDERAWNVGQDRGRGVIRNDAWGTSVSHAYEASSADVTDTGRYGDPGDKPRNGPARGGEWNLPAYQVRVTIHWAIEWAQQWDQWERTGSERRCCHTPAGGSEHDACHDDERYAGCANHWEGWSVETYDVYGWVHHSDGWYVIDLRNYGEPSWTFASQAVRSSGDGVRWGPVLDVVPVPVIEVQSVLSEQR